MSALRRRGSKIQDSFVFLARYLKDMIKGSYNGRVYYIPNMGNWGDAMIREGTLKFFKENRINVIELPTHAGVHRSTKDMVPKKSLLLIGGGGGWSRKYHHGLQIIDMLWQAFDEVIVLPSSYEHALIVPNATYWCRDREAMGSIIPSNRAWFCHDLALNLEAPTHSKKIKPDRWVGYVMRNDDERSPEVSSPAKAGVTNCDEVYAGEHDHLSPTVDFFERVSRAGRILHTDRLHCAIAACLLGREVHLYPCSYSKSLDVYSASLMDNFNITWHHTFPDCGFDYVMQLWSGTKADLVNVELLEKRGDDESRKLIEKIHARNARNQDAAKKLTKRRRAKKKAK